MDAEIQALRIAYVAPLGGPADEWRVMWMAVGLCVLVLTLAALELLLSRPGVPRSDDAPGGEGTAPSALAGAPCRPRDLTPAELEALLLGRLARLAELSAEPTGIAEQELVRAALLSTFRDCLALGLGDRAYGVLAASRGMHHSTTERAP